MVGHYKNFIEELMYKKEIINPNLEKLIVSVKKTIKDAMITINDNGFGICFVIDPSKRLLNLLTDGDIRRCLISGKTLDTNLGQIPKTEYFFLKSGYDHNKIPELLKEYKIIPVLNSNNEIVDFLSRKNFYNIPLINTDLTGKESKYVNDCLITGWVSSIGSYVKAFEDSFSEKFKFNNSLSVSSGTTGLQLALTTLGIGKHDEVIVPNLTFAASINAIINAGATPVLADVEVKTACIDVKFIEKLISNKTKAIMLVHLYGFSCQLDKIYELANKHKLLVIEDCAEALGTKFQNMQVGINSDAAVFSFFGNKLITTGEGGMICFKEKEMYKKAKKLAAHGMDPDKKYWHNFVGFNFRLTNLQAALGLGQLERIDSFIKSKQKIASIYRRYLEKNPLINFQEEIYNSESSYWLVTIFLDHSIKHLRDKLLVYLQNKGIECRPCFYPLNEMPPYTKYKKLSLTNSIELAYSGISLPTGISKHIYLTSFFVIEMPEKMDAKI